MYVSARNKYLKDYGISEEDVKKNIRLLSQRQGIRSAMYFTGGTRGISGNRTISISEPDNRLGL